MRRRPRSLRRLVLVLAFGLLVLGVPEPAGAAASRPNPQAVAFWKALIRAAHFSGLGAWVDVYDWSPTVTGGRPRFTASGVDELARRGVQVLYVQTSRWTETDDVVDRDTLVSIVGRARANRMRVVGWYLPTFVDPGRDLRRFGAMVSLGVNGIGVDMEDTTVEPVERSRRLVVLSFALRWFLPDMPLAAITLPNVVTDVINLRYWPGFPWTQIAPFYDVWMPMGYWTNRSVASGYRDAYRYTAENVDRLRNQLGRPNAFVHPVGGIADQTTPEDLAGFVRAATERRAIGGSLYDVGTMSPEQWGPLVWFRR